MAGEWRAHSLQSACYLAALTDERAGEMKRRILHVLGIQVAHHRTNSIVHINKEEDESNEKKYLRSKSASILRHTVVDGDKTDALKKIQISKYFPLL